MEVTYFSCFVTALAVLSMVSSQTIDLRTRRPPKTSNYLSCNKCFGHGLNPNADPRCRYGCDKNMTYPPPTSQSQTDMTDVPLTVATATTEFMTEYPRESLLDASLDYAYDEESGYKVNARKHAPSPMMKLIPRVNLDAVPMITREQQEQYERVISFIRYMKERESVGVHVGDDSNSMMLVVAICSMILVVALITLAIVIYVVFGDRKSVQTRTTFPTTTTGLSLQRLKIEDV